VDRPEVSLDDWAYRYESGLFVRYLTSRMGPKFLSDVWMTAEPQETPLEAIGHLLGQNSSNTCELFKEYCIDAFFLWDHTRPAFVPEVYSRFGERAVAERFKLRLGATVTRDLTLPHLACQYFRVDFAEGVNTVHLQASSPSNEMRFDVVGVQPDGTRGAATSLPSRGAGVQTRGVEHFVLIASHCGTKTDQADYRLEISTH